MRHAFTMVVVMLLLLYFQILYQASNQKTRSAYSIFIEASFYLAAWLQQLNDFLFYSLVYIWWER